MNERSRFDSYHGDEGLCDGFCGLCDDCIDRNESRADEAYELFMEREYYAGGICHD